MEQEQSEIESPKRVLVADDDAAICALLEKVLRPFVQVTSVGDAETALSLLATEPPFDAIVSDFMLPGINGLEFVQRVRSEQAVRVPILMISGHGRLVSDSAKAAGCDAFLDKPFTLAQLRSTMCLLLGSSVTFA